MVERDCFWRRRGGLLRRGLETEMVDSEEILGFTKTKKKRFSKCLRESVCACVGKTNEMANNEKAPKMKRDTQKQKTKKKQNFFRKFRTRGQFRGLLQQVIGPPL